MSQENSKQEATTLATDAAEPKLEGDQLKEALRKQIDFYFSPQNLAADTYLVSQMKQMYVPVQIVAGFQKIKNLTTDLALILEAIKESKLVSLDETGTKMKPTTVTTTARTTLILRDIPTTTPIDEIKKLFSQDNQPKNIQGDIHNTWYITFDTEANALKSLDHVRTQTFQNKPVAVRIKSENIVKSVATLVQPPLQQFAQLPDQIPPYGAPYYDPQYAYYGNAPYEYNDYEYFAMRGGRGGGRGGGRRGGRGGGRRHADSIEQQVPQGGRRPSRDEYSDDKRRGGRGSRKPRHEGKRSPYLPNQPIPNLENQKSFPPLPAHSKSDIPMSGYEGSFIKFSKQQIIDVYNEQVVKNAANLKRPEGMPANCTAVVSTPNLQLELTKPLPSNLIQDATPSSSTTTAATTSTVADNTSKPDDASTAVNSTANATTTTSFPTSTLTIMPITPVKSFAEAAITAKDIKTPEQLHPTEKHPRRRGSKKGRSNSTSKQNQQHHANHAEHGKVANQKQQQPQQQPARVQQQDSQVQQQRKKKHKRGGGRSEGSKKEYYVETTASASSSSSTTSSRPPQQRQSHRHAKPAVQVAAPEATSIIDQQQSFKTSNKSAPSSPVSDVANTAATTTNSNGNNSYAAIANKAKSPTSANQAQVPFKE